MSDASKRKEKQAIEKPKLENARNLRGIFFTEPDDDEFKRIMKSGCRKLKISTSQAQGDLLHSWTTQDEICLYC